jgi:hypothetical protein
MSRALGVAHRKEAGVADDGNNLERNWRHAEGRSRQGYGHPSSTARPDHSERTRGRGPPSGGSSGSEGNWESGLEGCWGDRGRVTWGCARGSG